MRRSLPPAFLLVAAVCCEQQHGLARELLVDAISPQHVDNKVPRLNWTPVPRGGGGATDTVVVTTALDAASAPSERVSLTKKLDSSRRMPCLFEDEEEIYDRYAACLAATEGLRRIRDRQIIIAHASEKGSRANKTAEKKAAATYYRDSSKVVESMGMQVAEFNEIGRTLCRDATLKQKVIEQAYLYRIESSMTVDRLPVTSKSSGSASSGRSVSANKLGQFCRSAVEIETLRTVQTERLKNHLQVDMLPVSFSNPTLLPLLSPDVRAVVEAFPIQAETIVKKHGLETDEFNRMLEQTKTNPLLRWKVQRQMKKKEAAPTNVTTIRKERFPTFGRHDQGIGNLFAKPEKKAQRHYVDL